MPIKVPAYKEREYRQDPDRRRSSPGTRKFSDSLRDGFEAKAARLREKQEALGLMMSATGDTDAIAKARQEAKEARALADEARRRAK